MEDLLRDIIGELVEHPEDISIVRKRGQRGTVLELRVHQDDIARVIGKQGRVINALRVLAKAAATRGQDRVHLNLIAPGEEGRFDGEERPRSGFGRR